MLYLFNTNIIPDEAVVRVKKISSQEATSIVHQTFGNSFESAIGHESTAAAMSELLGTTVPVNRIVAIPVDGDHAISLKLNGRLPEGEVLNREQLEGVGYQLFRIDFYDSDKYQITEK